MTDLYIFDIDGTLSDASHRIHFTKNQDDPQRWDKFYEAAVFDPPREDVIRVLETLRNSISDIRLFTGRPERIRDQTHAWLREWVPSYKHWGKDAVLNMRSDKDHTPDFKIKKQWYEALPEADKRRLKGVFEDRQSVCDMWRSLGITCFQVAKGDF